MIKLIYIVGLTILLMISFSSCEKNKDGNNSNSKCFSEELKISCESQGKVCINKNCVEKKLEEDLCKDFVCNNGSCVIENNKPICKCNENYHEINKTCVSNTKKIKCKDVAPENASSDIIDVDTDPNSIDTPKRLAKMYVNEIMSGRYNSSPSVTAFPNTIKDGDEEEVYYDGMLITRCPITSVCSHHHQPIKGEVFIGILPEKKVLGLSKYSRIVDWVGRRGILQEAATIEICNEIMKVAQCEDVAVYMEATHGCCENRGIKLANSLTQTARLEGCFKDSESVRSEFYSQIQLSKMGK